MAPAEPQMGEGPGCPRRRAENGDRETEPHERLSLSLKEEASHGLLIPRVARR